MAYSDEDRSAMQSDGWRATPKGFVKNLGNGFQVTVYQRKGGGFVKSIITRFGDAEFETAVEAGKYGLDIASKYATVTDDE